MKDKECGCRIGCDCHKKREHCNCNCGYLFTCDKHLAKLEIKFQPIKK